MSPIIIDYRVEINVFHDCDDDDDVLVTDLIQFTLLYREIRVMLINSIKNKFNIEFVKKLMIYSIQSFDL